MIQAPMDKMLKAHQDTSEFLRENTNEPVSERGGCPYHFMGHEREMCV